MDYLGHCHCRAVGFRVSTSLSDPVRCNCSFCVRRGALLQKMPADRFELQSGQSELVIYGSRDFSDHFFCRRCGVHVFTRSTRNGEDAVVVNIGCLDGVDIETLEPRLFDGANRL